MNQVFEVTGAVFDGGDDETDGDVFWVKAESGVQVMKAIEGCGATYCGPLSFVTDEKTIDFVLPLETNQFRAALNKAATA